MLTTLNLTLLLFPIPAYCSYRQQPGIKPKVISSLLRTYEWNQVALTRSQPDQELFILQNSPWEGDKSLKRSGSEQNYST